MCILGILFNYYMIYIVACPMQMILDSLQEYFFKKRKTHDIITPLTKEMSTLAIACIHLFGWEGNH